MKSQHISVPIGTSLLLVVFVLLALITFASLSFVTANTDSGFSEDTADRTKQYYAADATASITLKNIDDILSSIDIGDEQVFFDEVQRLLGQYEIERGEEITTLTYFTAVNEYESIETVIALYHDKEERYELKTSKLIFSDEWEQDNTMSIFLEE